MQEDLSPPEMAYDCCLDGDVVSAGKLGSAPGLLSVEQGFDALLGCRLPHLQVAAACHRCLKTRMVRIRNQVHRASVFFENNDISRARRLMRTAAKQLDRLSNHVARVTVPGQSCAGLASLLANQTANASDLAIDVVAELNQNANP